MERYRSDIGVAQECVTNMQINNPILFKANVFFTVIANRANVVSKTELAYINECICSTEVPEVTSGCMFLRMKMLIS